MDNKQERKDQVPNKYSNPYLIGCGVLTLGTIAFFFIGMMMFLGENSPGSLVAMFRYGASTVIFIVASFLVYRLWWLVLDALGGGSSTIARGLLKLLGNVGIDVNTGDTTRVRVTGVGLLGTVIIILLAVVAIYFLLSAEVGDLSNPDPFWNRKGDQ